jgi:pimeloyl-ACP methyl ester carboxylesterase
MLRSTIVAVLWLGIGPASTVSAQSIREASADIPGAHLFYLDSGGAETPVVFLHANTGSSRVWEYQIPAVTAAGYRFIAFDRRGWGRTTLDPNGPQPRTGADDLLALLDRLGIERVHLVGTAAGGFVALDFALSYPQRLRSLVFANSIGGIEDKDFTDLGRRIRPPQFDALPPEVRELGPGYRAGHAEGTQKWVDLEKISRPEGPRAPAQPLKNHITLAMLETIKVPTLLLTGGADMYAPAPVLRLFAAHFKNAETVIVPDAGHSTYWEEPEAFNRAVLTFWKKH